MIKFFTLLILFNIFNCQAQAQGPVDELQKLIQAQIKNIDLESLGLDNIEKKPTSSGENVENSSNKLIDNIAKIENKNIEDPNVEKKIDRNELLKENINDDNLKINKIKDKKDTKNVNKKNKKYATKKKTKLTKNQLRIELENKEKIALDSKIQEEKLKKLEALRNLYLSDFSSNNTDLNQNLEEEEIIPRRKELAPFALEELPPLPILNRSRTVDNFHIPFVYTPKEYIDIMFSAISMGSISYFNEAFKYVLNPNATNDQGDTILTYAIFLKKYSVISSVLAKGADPNLPNKFGHTPVSIAIELVDFQALELLEKNNVDLTYKDAFGRTYLMHASRVGFLPAVDLLVKNNLNINDMDNDGFTALSIAYRHRKELIVQYLLKNGAKTWVEKTYNPEKKYFINDLKNRWK